MATAILDQVQQLVDQLSPLEQVKLLEYLTPRIVRAVAQQPVMPISHSAYEDAWAELFRIGETIAAGDTHDAPTLTTTILSMRR
jgi:hypothetical protein